MMGSGLLPYVLLSFPVVLFGLLAYLLLLLYVALKRDLRETRQAVAASTANPTTTLGPALNEMVTELRKTADEIGRDLARRSAVLQRQIDEADRKLALIEEKLKALAAAEAAAARAVRESPAETASRPVSAPRREEPRPSSRLENETTLTPVPSPAARERDIAENGMAPALDTTATAFRPVDLREANKYQLVLRLAEEGLDSLEIAKRTRLGREEVELLLGLREEGRPP
ncbi:MAG: hypothetical protein HYY04_05000 [Chloroflexi bacterium]|nr:hypothetical protein [Chloroflexota bacterium]